ncbi:uncharacterized protein PG986_010180 [Apiospora aurea]|uniref:Heterokaryon incompatibility domain-containing protein n=1 Tax=Apiospora aurea TaxID=335848 RepID=A0ABR1Q9R5_9PEZI
MRVWGEESKKLTQELPILKAAWSARLARFDDASRAIYKSRMSTFAGLIERSWFRRVWIIQEIANPQHARIMCGNESVPSRIFSTMHHLMDLKTPLHVRAVMEVMPGPLRRQSSWWNEDRRLATLLLKFNGSEATEEHDRIYALLGIASDAQSWPIEYGRPFQDVVHQTISILILGDAGLSQLLTKPLLFDSVFLGVTSISELIMRVFELALQNSEAVLLRHLAHAPAAKAISVYSVLNYTWTEPYFRSVFGLYVRLDLHTIFTLIDICKSALERHHYFVCDEVFQMVEFKPTSRELSDLFASVPNSAKQDVIKQMVDRTATGVYTIIKAIGNLGHSHYHLIHTLLDEGVGSDLVPDDKSLARVAAEDQNDTILCILLDRLKAAGAEGLGSFAMNMLSLMGVGRILDDFSRDDMTVLQTAIGCGVDMKASDPKWVMALLRKAIRYKGPETIRFLVVGGADLSLRDADRGTPLHFAEEIDRESTLGVYRRNIAVLILLGADELAEDYTGRTPWQRNVYNILNTKRRSKSQMEELLLVVCAEDRHLYAGLLEGREEGDDTGGHSEEAPNSKRAREDDDGVVGVGEPRKSRRGRR